MLGYCFLNGFAVLHILGPESLRAVDIVESAEVLFSEFYELFACAPVKNGEISRPKDR